jgi:hypothetical protein
MNQKKRIRRSDQQMIEDLQTQLERLKKRAQTRKATRSPSLKHTAQAVRSIDAALAAVDSAPLKKALQEAREPLVAYLMIEGIAVPKPRGRKPGRRGRREQVPEEAAVEVA